MRKVVAFAAVGLLSACAPDVWVKPGATQAQFNKDDYACRRDAIASGGAVYYGYGIVGRTADQNMYQRCMIAAGYTRSSSTHTTQSGTNLAARSNAPTQPTAPGQQAGAVDPAGEAEYKQITAEQRSMCTDPKFAPYFSKSPCLAEEVTFEQLADSSKISPEAKAILVELRTRLDALTNQTVALLRKYGGELGVKRVDLFMATVKVQNDQNNLDLYNGKITWGEYNKRRQQISVQFTEAERKLAE